MVSERHQKLTGMVVQRHRNTTTNPFKSAVTPIHSNIINIILKMVNLHIYTDQVFTPLTQTFVEGPLSAITVSNCRRKDNLGVQKLKTLHNIAFLSPFPKICSQAPSD